MALWRRGRKRRRRNGAPGCWRSGQRYGAHRLPPTPRRPPGPDRASRSSGCAPRHAPPAGRHARDQFPLPHGQAADGDAPRPCLDTWQVADGPFRAPGTRFPAAAKPRQGEVGGKFPAAVPDHLAVAAPVVRQANGIAGHLAGVLGAVPLADQDPRGRELVEELAFRPRSGRRSADVPPQRHPGRLVPAAPSCLLRLGAARPPGGSAIRGWGRAEPELFLSGATASRTR